MLTVAVGLVSALLYGAADFFGGMTSRRLGAVVATAVTSVTGLLLYLVLALLVPGRLSISAVEWGAFAGVFGIASLGLLYACLAIGPMSILSPITAVISAVAPIAWALAHGDRIGWLGWLGTALGLIAIVLVAFVRVGSGTRPSLRALLMAIGAGIGVGAVLIALDGAPDDSGLWPMIASATVSAAAMLIVAGLIALVARARGTGARRSEEDWRRGLPLGIVGGLVNGAANAGLLLGVRIGELSVIAVLTALYPIGTIVLARFVLHERIGPLQVVGLALAITASVLLALA